MSKIDQIHLRALMLCMSKMSKMSKIDQIHLRAVMLCMSKMSKMSKIDQIHLRAVMLCMSEDVEDGKRTYRHIFIIHFLNMVSFKCNAIYVEDVEDRSNIPKGCNAMYVGDVEDGKR